MINKISSAIGRFCYKFRILLSILGVVIFAAVIYTESLATISYTNDAQMDYIMDEFPEDTLVIVYATEDEDKVVSVVSDLDENDPYVAEVQGYYNTLALEMDSITMTAAIKAAMGEDSEISMDRMFIDLLYYVKAYGTEDVDSISLYDFINFVGSDEFLSNDMVSSMMDENSLAMITEYKDLVNDIHDETEFTADDFCDMFNITGSYATMLKNMLFSKTETMTISEFVSAVSGYSSFLGDSAAMVTEYQTLVTMIENDTPLSPAMLAMMFSSMATSDDTAEDSAEATEESTAVSLDKDTITLLYLLYWSQNTDLSDVTMSLEGFFNFLCDDVVTNELFAPMITDEYAKMLTSYQTLMADNKAQLHGDAYSRVILTITYVPESDEIYSFYETLNETLTDLDVEYYFVGSTAMSYELSLTFQSEYMLITILTAIVIFIVVCLTFRKFSVSAFLVCIIECAVFITMTVMAIMNSAMYFIALMMVQCILMGSMVDYGILMSSYYKEVRRTLSKKEALPVVMQKSITAIFTSALIMIGVCFILSFTVSGAIASILRILGIGCLSALILIIFFLPALLSVADKLITKSWKDIKPFRAARKARKAARKNGTAAPVEDSAEPAQAAPETTDAPAAPVDAEPSQQEN